MLMHNTDGVVLSSMPALKLAPKWIKKINVGIHVSQSINSQRRVINYCVTGVPIVCLEGLPFSGTGWSLICSTKHDI